MNAPTDNAGISAEPSSGSGRPPTTRLAPSPTGALHLGNLRTFLVNWALAREQSQRILMRIEDLDGPRVKPESTAEILGTLEWVGIDWDGGPMIQTDDLVPYQRAMVHLAQGGWAYPSELSRSEIAAAASAPQEGGGENRFPIALRPADAAASRVFEDVGTNWRLIVPEGEVVVVDDGFFGRQPIVPSETIGDFVIWTRRQVPSYQLAVVVDDHRQGVTHVVRGADLLDSAARQVLLYRALGAGPVPAYVHLPLVVGADGRRLAKRHGDSRVSMYRAMGVRVEAVIGLMAWWCGVVDSRQEMSLAEFRERFRLGSMSREPTVFTAEDDQWLRSRKRS